MSTVPSPARLRPCPAAAPPEADWRAALAEAVTDPAELCELLGLPEGVARAAAGAAAGPFRLLVPRPYLARIRPGDPEDPLLVQVLPRAEEGDRPPGFTADPLGEAGATWGAGLLRKYQNRVLMVATAACAVHCRYCFRRHFPYADTSATPRQCEETLRRIASEPSIHEVILSGGDPLMLPDPVLGRLAGRLAGIAHLRRLRVHTRLPIVVPQRVTGELVAWLRGTRLAPTVVVHANHPQEIDAPVAAALGRLVDAGVPVLNQAVLLRGVNDRADVLAELCERLVDLRVMPYYLHQLDRVAGAAHFEVPESEGVRLVEELRRRLPGYAVPRYVRETPGRPNKTVLA
jgi:EF-P beta-lysylation protein EpmB